MYIIRDRGLRNKIDEQIKVHTRDGGNLLGTVWEGDDGFFYLHGMNDNEEGFDYRISKCDIVILSVYRNGTHYFRDYLYVPDDCEWEEEKEIFDVQKALKKSFGR